MIVLNRIDHAYGSSTISGIMHGSSALGPAVGFLFGGAMLDYYVDFDKVDMST